MTKPFYVILGLLWVVTLLGLSIITLNEKLITKTNEVDALEELTHRQFVVLEVDESCAAQLQQSSEVRLSLEGHESVR